MKNWLYGKITTLCHLYLKTTVTVVPDDRYGGATIVMESARDRSREALHVTLEDVRKIWHAALKIPGDQGVDIAATNSGQVLNIPALLVPQLRKGCRVHLFANFHRLTDELDQN